VWYVYFLRLANEDLYVGHTRDLRQRFAAHSDGRVPSTKGGRPMNLVCYLAVLDEPTARNLERYFKSGSGKALAKKRFLPG
jgi:putative endonuclease